MKAVAKELGQEVLRPVSMEDVVKSIPTIREKVGDRAILRSVHFQGDNARVGKQVEALESGTFQGCLGMVIVITSYSIHYTKLYELQLGFSSSPTSRCHLLQ